MCYTCHKLIETEARSCPARRCVALLQRQVHGVQTAWAQRGDLRAKIREGGGIVGLGNAGKQTAGAGRDFSKLAASFLQDRMEMILLQASLIGEDVTDCVIVVNIDDEPRTRSMTIPIDSYDISEMGSNGDADNDAHTRFVLERNRKAGCLTAMCHRRPLVPDEDDGPPGGQARLLVGQAEGGGGPYKPTVEYYRAECGGRLGMPRTEQAVQILNSLKDHGELPRPEQMAGLEEEIEHLQRVIAGGGGKSGGPARGATGDERRAVAAAVAAEMAASDGPGRNAKKNAKKRAKKKAAKGGPPPLEDISAGLESASLADCGPRVGDGAEAAAAEATYASPAFYRSGHEAHVWAAREAASSHNRLYRLQARPFTPSWASWPSCRGSGSGDEAPDADPEHRDGDRGEDGDRHHAVRQLEEGDDLLEDGVHRAQVDVGARGRARPTRGWRRTWRRPFCRPAPP